MGCIYLDYASSTPCDLRVVEAMTPFFYEHGGNASSAHGQGSVCRKALEDARAVTASFMGANPSEIIFTGSATESNNHAIFSTARLLKARGRHIVASAIEHHSVMSSLERLHEEGFEISFVRPQTDGILTCDAIESALREDTILVCVMHANNEIGTLQPVAEIGALLRGRGIYFLVDATQTVGHCPVNVRAIGCDFLSFAAHKFYGPQGVGGLYVRQGTRIEAFILGGDQERGLRAGTSNTAGIVGLGAALKLCERFQEQEADAQRILRERIVDEVLREIPGAVFNGHRQKRLPNNAHFSFLGIQGDVLVSALSLSGIAVSMGSACRAGRLESSHTLKAIGLEDSRALGALRVSLGRWTQDADVTFFLEQLKLKVKQLRGA